MSTERSVVDADPNHAKLLLEQRRMGLEAGWLGYVFGTGTNAASNAACFIVTILGLAGVVILFLKPESFDLFWKTTGAVLTGALGFLFGRKS